MRKQNNNVKGEQMVAFAAMPPGKWAVRKTRFKPKQGRSAGRTLPRCAGADQEA